MLYKLYTLLDSLETLTDEFIPVDIVFLLQESEVER